MNRKWRHFSTIRASDLQLLDAADDSIMKTPEAPDVSAWAIHGGIHASVAHARVLLHLHPPYATAVATLADPEIKPIEQNTARFYNRVAVDLAYTGIAEDKAEGKRLARVLGNRRTMMMGNHGVLCAAPTVAEAFEDMYFLERACQTLVLAYSTGQKLNIMPHDSGGAHRARLGRLRRQRVCAFRAVEAEAGQDGSELQGVARAYRHLLHPSSRTAAQRRDPGSTHPPHVRLIMDPGSRPG